MSGPASVELYTEIPPHYARLFAIAERDARRAVGLARRWYTHRGELPFEQAMAAYALGYAWLRWERLDAAAPLLASAQAQFAALGQAQLELHVRRAQLYLALLRGGDDQHAAEWATLALACEKQGDRLGASRARLGQIVQLNVQGLAGEALILARRVESDLEQRGTPGDHAWLWRSNGMAFITQAAIPDALRCLDRAAAGFAALGQPGELAKTWFEYSRAYERRRDLTQALRYAEQAYQAVQRLDLPLRVAFCLKNLGWFAALRGEYDRSLQLSLQAYDQLLKLHRLDYAAGCDLNLGNIAYYAGLWDLALSAYQRAEVIYLNLGHRRMSLLCRRNQALALRLSGLPEAALQLLRALMVDAEQLDERLEVGELLLAQGQALVDLGQTAEAERVLALAEARFRAIENDPTAGESLLELGWLLLRQGAFEQAAERLWAARSLLQAEPIYQWRADYGLGRCAEQRGDLPDARDRYYDACMTVARLRQRLANEHGSSSLFGQARELVDDAIRLAWQLGEAATMLDLAELQRSLALASSLHQDRVQTLAQAMPTSVRAASLNQGSQQELQTYLEQRLRRRRPLPDPESAAPARLDLPQLRLAFEHAFPSGWTLLAYVPCAKQLLTIIVDRDQIAVVADAFDPHLQELLVWATDPDYRPRTYLAEEISEGVSAWPTLTALGERLIPAQIRARLHPDHRLLIVASGALHSLPWAALRVDGRWLVEQATPQLLPGLLIWQELMRRQQAGNEALLIGVSQFGDRAEELEGVRPSLDLAAARWPGLVTRLEEAEATVAALLERAERGELRRYGLLHFATHGQLVAASGLLAHFKLADTDLLYDDILQLGLDGALVVLTACESAAAEVLPGEEVLSLSRAFLAAGARDVIASAWQLYDQTVPGLLDLLYAELSAGRAVPEALARAQRAWLARRSDDPERDLLFATPLVWAGLNVLGAGTTSPANVTRPPLPPHAP